MELLSVPPLVQSSLHATLPLWRAFGVLLLSKRSTPPVLSYYKSLVVYECLGASAVWRIALIELFTMCWGDSFTLPSEASLGSNVLTCKCVKVVSRHSS